MVSSQLQTLRDRLGATGLGRTICQFMDYMNVEAGLSENTLLGYGRDLLGCAQHLSLENDLPIALLDVRLQVLRDRVEVDGVQVGPRAVRPLPSQQVHYADGFELVGATAEIAQHVVDIDTTLQHQPGRNRRVEAPADECDRSPLDPERESSGRRGSGAEEVRLAGQDLHVDRDLGIREIYPRRARCEHFSEGALGVPTEQRNL